MWYNRDNEVFKEDEKLMKAVIYARYSCDNQREESIEGQLRECKAFAEKKDMTVIGTYIDRAMSAKTDNRPEFQRMITESSKGLFETVIVWKLDRFARSRYDSARYKMLLRRNGVKVVSATEVISEGAEGIILESVVKCKSKCNTFGVFAIINHKNGRFRWSKRSNDGIIHRKSPKNGIANRA